MGKSYLIYLDNNATTRPDASMLGALNSELLNFYGNASSTHEAGRNVRDSIEISRENVAQALGVKSSQIIFTSGGTEANNMALTQAEDGHVYCVTGSSIEHSSVFGFIDYPIGIDKEGGIDFESLESYIRSSNTRGGLGYPVIASFMMANNETGVILDPENKIGKLKDKYEFIYHVDAIQAFGKMPFKIPDYVDFLTISAHKVHGLKGCGALYAKSGLATRLFKHGGIQEFGLRPGTENHAGIFSLGYMAEKMKDDTFYGERVEQIHVYRDLLEHNLKDVAKLNGCKDNRLCNTSSLYFEEVTDNNLFLEQLSTNGVFASAGSACASGMPEPSKTISAMFGKNSSRSKGSVRFSLSVETTRDEIEKASSIIKDTLEEYRRM